MSETQERGRRRFLRQMAAGLLGTGGAIKIGKGDSAVSAWTGQRTNSVLNQAKPLSGKNDLRIAKVADGNLLSLVSNRDFANLTISQV